MQQALSHLINQLPDLDCDYEELQEWWKTQGLNWAEAFRIVTTEHRNIGHNWQFSDRQIEKLGQYYAANLLLVNCLNSDCYVTREVREQIEATLLLPAADTAS